MSCLGINCVRHGASSQVQSRAHMKQAPDGDQMVTFCDQDLRQCDYILHLVARVLPVNLPVFFYFIFFTLVKG